MFIKYIKAIGVLVLIFGIIYLAHKSIFSIFKFNENNFIYSLEQLYLFFGLFSVTIQLILIKVKEKNLDIVGNVFLLLTLIKMMVCFALGSSILKTGAGYNSLQKWNFLILFLVFLTIETVLTIIMLNKKEE